jgi:nifR3 family TIM-barrel protein
MFKGFWENLKKPIIGFAPMDGVTDAACRFITDKYGRPHILFTEFTSVEGIDHGAEKLLEAFIYHKTETPTVAQVFGADLNAFYKAAFVVGEMGFNGIDINMGCPDANVAKKGGGAGLIRTPKLAQSIIKMTQKGIEDWASGKTIEETDLKPQIVHFVREFQKTHQITPTRWRLPVSVKTRIGFDSVVTEDWIQYLLEAEPVNITVHGRTLKQLYSGAADWEEIAKAAELAHKTETTLLGNGDIKSIEEAQEKIRTYNTDGVLIGRGAWGNPWIFSTPDTASSESVPLQLKFKIALEHAEKFAELLPNAHFLTIRKHLAWYTKGFDNASSVRSQLMKVNSVKEIKEVIEDMPF